MVRYGASGVYYDLETTVSQELQPMSFQFTMKLKQKDQFLEAINASIYTKA